MRSLSSVNCACGRSTPEQIAAQFALELLDGPGEGRLGNVALLGRLGEIELADGGQEISHLMHFHGGDLQRISQSAFSSFDPARALSGRALRNAEILMVGATGIEPVT